MKYIMQKAICFIFLTVMPFLQISEAANHPAMPNFKRIYDSPPLLKFHSATRPKVNKNKDDQTSVEEDMKSAEKDNARAPISNPEDKVIEFIVTDIGH